jgi:hypothetical protein
MTTKNEAVMLRVQDIIVDAGTQMRASNNDATIEEYADAMREGEDFPPLSVVSDGTNHWLYDGFHRHAAGIKAGSAEMPCIVQAGTLQDACWHAIGANGVHGLPRTNADKRNAVLAALAHPASADMTTREVAKKCLVSHTLVANIKLKISDEHNPYRLPELKAGFVYKAITERLEDQVTLMQHATILPHPNSPGFVLVEVYGPRGEIRVTERGLPREQAAITFILKKLGFVLCCDIEWDEISHDGSTPGWYGDGAYVENEDRRSDFFEKHRSFPSIEDDSFWGPPKHAKLSDAVIANCESLRRSGTAPDDAR